MSLNAIIVCTSITTGQDSACRGGPGAAYVYSGEHGGVMLWQNENEPVGYCMDTASGVFRRRGAAVTYR